MAQNTLIDFKRLKPLTIDGLWYSDYGDGSGVYPFKDDDSSHFYYWMVDNIPFLRLNERDALFARTMNLGYVAAFPYQNYANVVLADLTPVIVDFQNGYIHQNFSKQDLDVNESIGFVLSNLDTGSTSYTDGSGIQYYYVVLNLNNAILPFSAIKISSSQTHLSLVPEQTKLYVNLHGELCTLAYQEEKMSRLDENNVEVLIEVGNVIKVTASACICSLSSSIVYGASTGLDNIAHSNLEDVEAYEVKKELGQDLCELYVYGHYGHQTRIYKYSSTLPISISVGDAVSPVSTNSIQKFTSGSQFIGFLYYVKETDSGYDYYVVTAGEYTNSTWSLTAGDTYFINRVGTLVGESSSELTIYDLKIGVALSTTTMLIESNTSSFNSNFLSNVGISSVAVTAKGDQISSFPDSFGIPAIYKVMGRKSMLGSFPILTTFSWQDPVKGPCRTEFKLTTYSSIGRDTGSGDYNLINATSSSSGITYSYNVKTYGFQNTIQSPTTSTWASGWGATPTTSLSADLPMYGLIKEPTKLFIQRLSPEYDASGDVKFERLFIYMSPNEQYNTPAFLNALSVNASGSTSINWSPTFQSDMEYASHALSAGANPTLTYGATGELTITLDSGAPDFTFTSAQVTGSSAGNKVYHPSRTLAAQGISLKPNNGMVAFYNSTTTPVCSSTIYCFYEKVEATGVSKQYKFTNCTLFNTKFLSTPTATAIQPNYVISMPSGAFTFKVGGTSDPVIAGIFNPNPYMLSRFSKQTPFIFNPALDVTQYNYRAVGGWTWTHICSNWVKQSFGTVYPYRQVLGPMGYINYHFGQMMYSQSFFNSTVPAPYPTLEATASFTYPLVGLVSGITAQLTQSVAIDQIYNFYRYIDIDTMYLNPHATYSILSTILSELNDRIPAKLRLGMISNPYGGRNQGMDIPTDSFVFCNAQTALLGLSMRNGLFDSRNHKVGGVGTIVYIARTAADDVEDYVDIHLDSSALAYQIMGDFGNHIPATGTVSAIDHAYNLDIVCYVNGKEFSFGPNDTIRLWLPPYDVNDLRYDMNQDLSTRQKPYLTLHYTTVASPRAEWINDLMFYKEYPIQPPGVGGNEQDFGNEPRPIHPYAKALNAILPPHTGD